MWLPAIGRVCDQSTGTQICERIGLSIDRCQARDPLPAHCHDHLSTACDVADVSAEVVVKLADTNFAFEILL